MPFWLQTPTEVLHHRQLGATLQIWGDIHITKKTLKKHVRLCRLGNLRKITPKKITHPKKKGKKKVTIFWRSVSQIHPLIHPYHPIHTILSIQLAPASGSFRIPTPSPSESQHLHPFGSGSHQRWTHHTPPTWRNGYRGKRSTPPGRSIRYVFFLFIHPIKINRKTLGVCCNR